jgi:hypothetical protein
MTKDEALRMAIEWLDNQQLGYSGHSVRKACQDALAQPTSEQSSLVQEPVAWKDKIYGNLHHADYGDSIPLYTTPPSREWQSLSDAEIEEAVNFLNVKIDYPIMFARLIEMHLKEKNNE